MDLVTVVESLKAKVKFSGEAKKLVNQIHTELDSIEKYHKTLIATIATQKETEIKVIRAREEAEKTYATIAVKLDKQSQDLEKQRIDIQRANDTIVSLKSQIQSIDNIIETKRKELYGLEERIKAKAIETERDFSVEKDKIAGEQKKLSIMIEDLELQRIMLKTQESESKTAGSNAKEVISALNIQRGNNEKQLQEIMELKKKLLEQSESIDKKKSELLDLESKSKLIIQESDDKLKLVESIQTQMEKDRQDIIMKQRENKADEIRLNKEKADIENLKIINKPRGK